MPLRTESEKSHSIKYIGVNERNKNFSLIRGNIQMKSAIKDSVMCYLIIWISAVHENDFGGFWSVFIVRRHPLLVIAKTPKCLRDAASQYEEGIQGDKG